MIRYVAPIDWFAMCDFLSNLLILIARPVTQVLAYFGYEAPSLRSACLDLYQALGG